ncbi:MAG TPA: ABC transporter ATP-binding protein [Cyanobacteria bacterium UBA11149]|nr:ABC transporter ATP-binding protein [Cyanobacteria bacterium UBA11367]HBE59788.1 ABC transporter ATP-binding protein [Cyanobacteria bacterium UBA11366]HBK64274.1 ABC transporter ATP-binding protein [Cyanobacteria bacterium UBA11166]HBR72362.1 ABC transporter ATP-binding protein [Cyanobacteria bacterium UBA11159]HBS70853.1 ABC transporter ATP-binding protein [Cyanobacteria bacterium UBA11153]HBW89531.1 ABC transporter ATP-binding protein [Cyanobacteria bacterium UBA11149]HCA94279.1 ABC tran
MSEIAVSLKNVSKCFKRYPHPADRLKELLFPGKSRAEEFWALRDINLEVIKGQTLGIVGRNGSGKSTLLQIIVGTLTATTGEVQVNGRVSALLELGSGFNPEFTGRQNVFFNGRILGLPEEEIEAKFDEIAAFADIGDFIEQPVKTYSSGMFVRLAFAVAISVNPDILVVDEALAVGDEAFQRKCFARIQGIQERGGTILFVSHAASSVVELCDRAILIDYGELLLSGSPKLVVSKYQKLIYAPPDKIEELRHEIRDFNSQKLSIYSQSGVTKRQIGTKLIAKLLQKGHDLYDPGLVPKTTISYIAQGAKIENPCITNKEGKVINILSRGKDYIYSYEVKFTETAYKVQFGMLIKTVSGFELGGGISHPTGDGVSCIESGTVVKVEFKFSCRILPGVYFVNAGVLGIVNGSQTYMDRLIDAAMFRVQTEEDLLVNTIVDFNIEPSVLLMMQQVTA